MGLARTLGFVYSRYPRSDFLSARAKVKKIGTLLKAVHGHRRAEGFQDSSDKTRVMRRSTRQEGHRPQGQRGRERATDLLRRYRAVLQQSSATGQRASTSAPART